MILIDGVKEIGIHPDLYTVSIGPRRCLIPEYQRFVLKS